MPLYQVSYKVNSRSYNTDIEAKNIDAVKKLFSELSVGHITEIKEYVYFGEVKKFDTNPDYNEYATVKIYFNNHYPLKVKVPKFRFNKDFKELISYLSTIYKDVKSFYTYTST